MELMQSNAVRMATYGIVIGIPQLTLTLSANIETATKSDYRREFRSAMHAIRKKYVYNHVHDATSLQTILTELAGANGVRALRDAPTPKAGTAHSVANSVSFLNSMMLNSDTDSEYTVLAYGASSDSNSSKEQRKSRKHKHKKPKKAKAREKKKKRRPRTMSQRRTRAPIARNTTARSHIELNQTNTCGTKNLRGTASSRSAMSSRSISSHASNFQQNWVGMRRRTIRAANDGARGHQRKERTRRTNGEVKLKNYSSPNSNPQCIMHLSYFPNPMTPPATT
jgi:hypothetical protein